MRTSPLRLILAIVVALATTSCFAMSSFAAPGCAAMAAARAPVGDMDHCPRDVAKSCSVPCLVQPFPGVSAISPQPAEALAVPPSPVSILLGRDAELSTPPPRLRSV